jgi:hypothetical protein
MAKEVRSDHRRRRTSERDHPNAIAGAIAWEALENVLPSSLRAVGPGKVHIYDKFTTGLLDQIVSRGHLPGFGKTPTTIDRKLYKELLVTPLGAIATIAAERGAFREIAAKRGFDISQRPAVLGWAFNTKDLDTWDAFLQDKVRGGEKTFDTSKEAMSRWISGHLGFLQESLGSSESTTPAESSTPSKSPVESSPPQRRSTPTRQVRGRTSD